MTPLGAQPNACWRREMRRLRDEGSSCFNNYQLMADGGGTPRYLLGNLLGKGGFSDVYRVRALHQDPKTTQTQKSGH